MVAAVTGIDDDRQEDNCNIHCCDTFGGRNFLFLPHVMSCRNSYGPIFQKHINKYKLYIEYLIVYVIIIITFDCNGIVNI